MRGQQFIAHLLGLVGCQRGRGVRIEKGCLVDVLAIPIQYRLDRQLDNVEEGPVECGQLWWQCSNSLGVQTIGVHNGGNLDATLLGKVGDQSGVAHIYIQRDGSSGLARVDELRGHIRGRL